MRKIIIMSLAGLAAGCSTISEESCIAGSWESLGYEDGREGESRGHFNKIAETCAKYGITANATQYRIGYDQALPLYCSYDKGISHGESGRSVKQECVEISAGPYLDGYEKGWAIYEIQREYENLIQAYDDLCGSLIDVKRRLAEDELNEKERIRLRKKKRRLERDIDYARSEIRDYERYQGLPRRDLSSLY